ncbi:hypothetical protein N0P67_003814, partial [Acinetobacter baumannii]|nr:hypothetical protein [Acinetobacter baumannii]
MIQRFLKLFNRKPSEIKINGKSYHGSNVVIQDDGIFIDGGCVQGLSPKIEVVINGDCDSVDTTSGNVRIEGNVG